MGVAGLVYLFFIILLKVCVYTGLMALIHHIIPPPPTFTTSSRPTNKHLVTAFLTSMVGHPARALSDPS